MPDYPRAEQVLAAIKAMSVDELRVVLKELEYTPGPLDPAGYVLLPRSVYDLCFKGTLEHDRKVIKALIDHTVMLANRGRKSATKTIVRNVEICDLRKANKKLWTLGRLGKKYGVNRRSITRVLEEEDKWRRLYAKRMGVKGSATGKTTEGGTDSAHGRK